MFWTQVKILVPSFILHSAFLIILSTIIWYGFTRVHKKLPFRWEAPFLFGLFVGLFFALNTSMNLYQNQVIVEFQRVSQQQSTEPVKTSSNKKIDPALQMKIDFLQAVNAMIQDPQTITEDNKKQLFSRFNSLFPNKNKERKEFERQIASVYKCQRFFWEDAMTTFKAKKVIKSDDRKSCEEMKGSFFGRKLLIPEQTQKANSQILNQLSNGKRVPASGGKDIDEARMREFLDIQVRAVNNIKRIFD